MNNNENTMTNNKQLQFNEHREEGAKDVVQKRDYSGGLPLPEGTQSEWSG